jgi:hypothetical protein
VKPTCSFEYRHFQARRVDFLNDPNGGGGLSRLPMVACSFDPLALFFNRYTDQAAPFGPGAIVIADLGIAE